MQEERKTQRRRRQELDVHYHAMLEDLPCFVCRFLPDCKIIFVNAKYWEYFGKTS